jgi:3-isopropylmalate/(R)-2-methylmalate dehydratase small subunit
VVESIQRGSYRNAINAGVPFLPACVGVGELVQTGDQIEVNFATGVFINHSRGTQMQYPPLAQSQLAIIAAGGWRAQLEARVAAMRAKG